ncbi:MAG: hypothetical protein HXX13_10515 [Bacteroidetes bacterium]|nr:hypothetical protein [Bacteroidota bacterium]
MEFILTIDTEADNQWDHGRDLSLENIKYIPRFQELCDKYQIRPTYLVTSEVCLDEYSRSIFRSYLQNHRCEIGAHLHSWTTGPFRDENGLRFNDKQHAFAYELPAELLNEKIATLTSQIKDGFGVQAVSFRSGRYGFNKEVAKILVDHSYTIDSSVTPFVSWTTHKGISGLAGGPDFMDASPKPYKYSFENGILNELPITILPTAYPFSVNHALARKYIRNVQSNIILKLLKKLVFGIQPRWLRPYTRVKLAQFESLIKQASSLELPYLVMMFHSSELMPGGSANFPDESSIDYLYKLLEELFIRLAQLNIPSSTLSEAGLKL